jgi:hypothetical protein
MLIFHNVPVIIAILGALLAYTAYRRRRGQRLDPRSELREVQEYLRAAMQALPAQLDLAKRLRTAATEATESLESEATQQWLSELDSDSLEFKMLESHLPAAYAGDSDLSETELDIRLVELLALSLRVDRLADKYRVPPSADERDCESPTDRAGLLSDPAGVRHPPLSLGAPS